LIPFIPSLLELSEFWNKNISESCSYISNQLLLAPYRAVGPKEFDRVFDEIVLDSLAPAIIGLIDNNKKKVIDLGCGSGIPSIPLALFLPLTEFIAIDSSIKRIEFAKCMAKSLNISNIVFRNVFLEKKKEKQKCRNLKLSSTYVIARGFSALENTCEISENLLCSGGKLIIYSTSEYWTKNEEKISSMKIWTSKFYPYMRHNSGRLYGLIELTKNSR